MPGPRFLYLHGFASGPDSQKGVVLTEHYAARGVTLERLDLRRPSLEHLRLSAIMEEVRRAMGEADERIVLFGSSLGGLTAARMAEEDPRVCALVLLAPAFRIFERWREKLGNEWNEWERTGWREVTDHAEKKLTRVDFGFVREGERFDERNDGWPDVRVPTLIVHGRADDAVSIETSRTFARDKRWVRLVETDDGHELVASLPIITREADAFLLPFLGR